MSIQDTGYQLLLVEDDPNLSDAISRKLGNAGFRVLRVGRGCSGVEIATTRAIDLIMLDLDLPDMRGEQVLEIVRDRSNLPVLIISCNQEECTKIAGLDLGADGYLTKPFSLKELEAYVRAILRRSTVRDLSRGCEEEAEPHTRLRCNGVELILDRRQAYVDGELIELTLTEFQILRYFIEHAGAAVSAQQLVVSVWGYNGYDRHIVETNVYRLRQKIEKDPRDPERLVTVRGYGYKFILGATATAADEAAEEHSAPALAAG
ncbi:MAG: response regulator transcription factor [Armatimonadota bacterium]|jgi:DNA-binding response OmpR family regulator